MGARVPYLRVGGRFEDGEGATVLWSVAEGSRGRRWRWARTAADGSALSALLETGRDGRAERLEVAGAAGLLVLHPERGPDGVAADAHGNVVAPDGVRPLAFAWGPGHVFDVVDLPWVAAACVAGEGRASVRPTLLVGRDLRVTQATRLVPAIADGTPPDGERWPLE